MQVLHQHEHLAFFTDKEQEEIEAIEIGNGFDTVKLQGEETVARYRHLSKVLSDVVVDTGAKKKFTLTDKIDAILTHKVFGFIIFFLFCFSSLTLSSLGHQYQWI